MSSEKKMLEIYLVIEVLIVQLGRVNYNATIFQSRNRGSCPIIYSNTASLFCQQQN